MTRIPAKLSNIVWSAILNNCNKLKYIVVLLTQKKVNLKREDDLNEINSLNEFYKILDKHSLELYLEGDLPSFILKYKDLTTNLSDKAKLQLEIEISYFEFYNKTLFPLTYCLDEESGEYREYPNKDNTITTGLQYIKQRCLESSSFVLKAKYNHLLWNEKTSKHKKYAENAIDNYIRILEVLIRDKTSKQYKIGRVFEKTSSLVDESKSRENEIKNISKKIITSNSVSIHSKSNVLSHMLDTPKIFKVTDFENTLVIYEKALKVTEKDYFDFSEYLIPIAIKISKKISENTPYWYNELANINLELAERESREWVQLIYLDKSIQFYQKSGNKEQKKIAEQLYFEAKHKVKLDTFRVDLNEEQIKELKDSQKYIKEQAKLLLQESPEYVYLQISKGSFFPKYKQVLGYVENEGFEPKFLESISSYHFDKNKNISKIEIDDESKILKSYDLRIKETLLPFLHYVIIGGIKSGHLTSKNMLNYFFKHTWIGKDQIKRNLGGELIKINWIHQISQPIIEFCIQTLAWGESKYYTPNFILCIDCLTLKIEGLFRNFSERLNVSTSIKKRQNIEEVLLHDIIDNEIIREYFNEDDILLFDYVFSNENGALNIRNNIAHCFYNSNEYHPDKMLLLLAVLFRLGKYNIEEKSKYKTD